MAEVFQAHIRPEGPSLPEADRHKEVEGGIWEIPGCSYSGVSSESWRKCRVLCYFKGILVSVFMTGACREHNARKAILMVHQNRRSAYCLPLLPKRVGHEISLKHPTSAGNT